MAYKIKCPDCNKWHYPTECKKREKKEKPKPITLLQVQEAYREMWKAQSIYKGKAIAYGRLKNEFLGLNQIEKELEKQYGQNI